MPSDSTRIAYQKAYREANKEKARAYAVIYRAAHKEKHKAYAIQHYADNVNAYKASAKQWAKENPEARYEVANKWRVEHPEVYRKARRKFYQSNKAADNQASRIYREKNPQKMRDLQAAWRASNPHANAHHVNLRRTRKMQAQPAWADLDAIKAIYKKAADLNRLAGERYHVDHEIPLKHPLVCGLHNEFNLRVITAFENHRKKNKFLAFS